MKELEDYGYCGRVAMTNRSNAEQPLSRGIWLESFVQDALDRTGRTL